MIMNYLHISGKLFSFHRIKSLAILLRSPNVRKMFRNGHDESSYNRKHIRKYSENQSHIAFSSF